MAGIHTYHCLCSQLLLATPYALSALPKRQSPALDGARILPLGKPPTTQDDEDMLHPDEATERNQDDELEKNGNNESTEVQYSLLLNTTLDRRAVVVRREDGFEKRWVRRCGRCRTGIGYVLIGKMEEGEGMGVVYLLEDGLVATDHLKEGEQPANIPTS